MDWTLLVLAALVAVGRPALADGGDYRLPTAFVPSSYDLEILPHLDADGPPFNFEGSVTINITVMDSTATAIVLHAGANLAVSAASAQLDGAPLTVSTPSVLDADREFLQVTLEGPLEAGTYLLLTLDFSGQLPTDMKGFYLSNYQHSGTTRYLAATKFEPTYARRAFPCFDEPALKATFYLRVIAPPGFQALSATDATITESSTHQNHMEYEFSVTPPMSTYLVSWVVFEPETYSVLSLTPSAAGTGSATLGPLGIASARALRSEWTLPYRVGQAALRELNKIFDGDLSYYSFMKNLHLVALPDFISGAMENWGMITFRERRLLMSDQSSSTETIQSVATTIVHEIVHQWFGDLVSPDWWTYLWLNEGFASYWPCQLDLGMDDDDEWRMADQFLVLELQTALRADASSATHPMSYDVSTPDQIQAIFDTVNYDKAASVIRMIEHMIGTDNFRAALKSYLQNKAYEAATEIDLFAALDAQWSAQLGRGLETSKMGDMFLSWSRSAGYPVVTVTRDYEAGTASLTQERFYDDPDETQDSTSPPWMVPITMAWQQDMFQNTTPTDYLLASIPLQLTDLEAQQTQWLVVNVQQTGFYRVQYDEQNWRLLQAQIESDPTQIHLLSRAQIVDDALALGSAGRIDYGLALDTTRFLSQEPDPLPWMAALPNFALLYQRLSNSDLQQNLLRYLRSIMEPVLERLGGFEGRPDLTHLERVLHAQLLPWACRVDLYNCRGTSVQEFSWITDSADRSVTADRRPVVYCEGLSSTTSDTIEATFSTLWTRFTDSATAPNEKNTLLNSFGCITHEATVHSFLERAVNKDGVRLQDVQTAFSSVISSPQGAQLALSFLKQNNGAVKAVLEEIGETSSVVNSMVQWLPSNQRAELLEAVSTWGISESLEKTITSLDRWMERNEPSLRDWLQREAPNSKAATLSATTGIAVALVVVCASLSSVAV